jgi:hypothetical protein
LWLVVKSNEYDYSLGNKPILSVTGYLGCDVLVVNHHSTGKSVKFLDFIKDLDKIINKPSFCQNKKIVAITSHFFKFQAQAAIKTLISSPTCPLQRVNL